MLANHLEEPPFSLSTTHPVSPHHQHTLTYHHLLLLLYPQDGNVNVIANDIGDRITPAVLSVMHAEEILVGVPAKANMVRNRSATVANNKQFFEPTLSEEEFEEYSRNW